MSSASIPAPRTPGSPSRHNYFWPILVYLIGAGMLAFYQVQNLEDQLSQTTSAADKLDSKVRMAQYEKAKFYALARDLLRMAPKHPAADKIVSATGIRNLAQAQPELMSLALPSGFTNSAPAEATPPPSEHSSSTNSPSALIQ
jgi:hypothetical protein